MKNKLLVLSIPIFLLITPAVALSVCFDLGQADSYYIQGAHAIIFYEGIRPLARVVVPNCDLYQDSTIRLTTNYTCDTDRIIVDGKQCTIETVSSSPTTPKY